MHIGHATHTGRVRELNEDGYLVLAPPAISAELTALLVVADGMGGHQAGDVASSEVIQVLNEIFSSVAYQERVGYSLDRDDYYVVVLKEVLEQLNDRLYNMQAGRPDLRGMGTTGSMGLFVGQQLYIGHVGDSRIYRLRGGELQHLTTDHSWVAEQVSAGAMTPEQAAVHPKRNLLTRCLGHSPVLRVERTVHQVQIGDVLLLCSDGLTGVVQDGELQQMLAQYANSLDTCQALVEMANQRGGPDNITVVIAQVAEGTGTDLPGGRAYGPHREDASAQLVDTVKIVRPGTSGPQAGGPQPAGAQAAATQAVPSAPREAPRPPSGRSASSQLLVPLLGLVVSVACGLLGMWALSLETVVALPGLQFLTVFVATMFGVVTGLALAFLWPPSRQAAARSGTRQEDEGDPPSV